MIINFQVIFYNYKKNKIKSNSKIIYNILYKNAY